MANGLGRSPSCGSFLTTGHRARPGRDVAEGTLSVPALTPVSGRRAPENAALAGLNGIEDGRYSTPTLTTVAPDKAQLARMRSTCSNHAWTAGSTGRPGRCAPTTN
uniref:hypothetical protein n=1 Tax=Nonomuraea bangladeshensis TaxID=404385 RepID=UPI003F494AAC